MSTSATPATDFDRLKNIEDSKDDLLLKDCIFVAKQMIL